MVLGSSVQFQISVHNYGEGHFLWALYENSRHLCRNSGFADVIVIRKSTARYILSGKLDR